MYELDKALDKLIALSNRLGRERVYEERLGLPADTVTGVDVITAKNKIVELFVTKEIFITSQLRRIQYLEKQLAVMMETN